jgi:hypothetical protein
MHFAYVAYSDANPLYLGLLKLLVDSVICFSKHNIIVYLINVDKSCINPFLYDKRINVRLITIKLPNIFCYKPYIIADAIYNGLKHGCYLDCDGLITPHADKICKISETLQKIPISPIHPDDVTPDKKWMQSLGINCKTQHYVHGHVIFKHTNISFIEEWYNLSLVIDRLFFDETALNFTYWNHGCSNHYIPICDPYYDEYYLNTKTRDSMYIFHGCKNLEKQTKLLEDMKAWYNTMHSIKYCIVASDDNPTYYTFYPLVRKFWGLLGIKTIFIFIGEILPESLTQYADEIILFKPVPNIHTAFQAQCIRVMYPALINSQESVITSDMDIIPLNKDYFTHPSTKYKNTSFVVYRNCIADQLQYPICYCLAKPSVWKNIFKIENESDICNLLREWYTSDYEISSPNSIGWAQDQLQLFKYVNEWEGEKILLSDDDTKFKRLDRLDDLNGIDRLDSSYTDFHMPRPYERYKHLIDDILFKHNLPLLNGK